MKLSRRGLFRGGAAASTAVVVTAAAPAEGATTAGTVSKVATLRRVFARGTKNAGGYAKLVVKPGEAHVVRTGLGVKAGTGRRRRRRGVIAFAQISDVHIIDAQSPLRVEYTDRFDDPGQLPITGLFASAYRPQEMLTAHVADAMVREINQIGVGPVTGLPLKLAIQTGDNSDNSQYNEVRWNIGVLDGGRVRADSGSLTAYEGVCDNDAATYDRAYWHPHRPPSGQRADGAKQNFGFPTVPGLLDAARRPFHAQGLKMPWYTAFGNHDGLVQGNFPASTMQLNAIATGGLKVISPPAGFSPQQLMGSLADGSVGTLLTSLTLTPGVREVTPDPNRRLLARAGIVAEHFKTSGLPVGHGFTDRNRRDGTAYYHFDKGECRFIVLDTVNPNGYADGSIDQVQFDWLRDLLGRSARRITMVFSHHTSTSMTNTLVGTGGDTTPRVTGDAVLKLLLANWEVVAWINGHTHRNEIRAHKRARGGGLWEINTASHVDWPQQSRIIEIADNRDNTLSIFTTMVDHAGPRSYGGNLSDSVHLAGLARELAANDWHNRTSTGRGTRQDRNVELLVKLPPRLQRY